MFSLLTTPEQERICYVKTMISQSFEIRVALVGYVSVGKTTVLNALFQDKWGDVSMKRTTAGINMFRIVSSSSHKAKWESDYTIDRTGQKKQRSKETTEELGWEAESYEIRLPASTLKEITEDNAALRQKNEIQEKTFDIELDEHLCKMRKDTKLVLVDIPGVNEAGSKNVYMDYCNDNWDTFDCVIAVLDAIQGANTEEQLHLLQQLNKNLSEKKNLPVIVLCNKVDDPDEAEMKVLVDEVCSEVERIFNVDSRKRALEAALDASRGGRDLGDWMWPVVIPCSAGNAFLYRTACRLNLEDFKHLDAELITKIGRDEIGRQKWNKLTQEQKYEVAYSAVSDDAQYKERLELTQFDKFMDILALSCGGEEVQREMIQKQIHTSLKKGISWEHPMADDLLSIYERCKAIRMPADALIDSFWREYAKHESHSCLLFSRDMDLRALLGACDQLYEYFDRFVKPVYEGVESVIGKEKKKVAEAMESLLEYQFGVVREKESTWEVAESTMMIALDLQNDNCYPDQWYDQATCKYYSLNRENGKMKLVDSSSYRDGSPKHDINASDSPFHWQKKGNQGWKNKITGKVIKSEKNPGFKKLTWKLLSPHDWLTIARSLLLLTHNKHMCERFGRDFVMLEEMTIRGKAARILSGVDL